MSRLINFQHRHRIASASVATLAILLAYTATAEAQSAVDNTHPARFMPEFTTSADAPSAFLAFCSRQPQACLSDAYPTIDQLQTEIYKRLKAKLFNGNQSDAIVPGAIETTAGSSLAAPQGAAYLSQRASWQNVNRYNTGQYQTETYRAPSPDNLAPIVTVHYIAPQDSNARSVFLNREPEYAYYSRYKRINSSDVGLSSDSVETPFSLSKSAYFQTVSAPQTSIISYAPPLATNSLTITPNVSDLSPIASSAPLPKVAAAHDKSNDDTIYYDGIAKSKRLSNRYDSNPPQPANAPIVTPSQHEAYTRLALSTGVWQTLESVNQNINRAIISTSDETQFRQKDFWFAPGTGRGARGDCEDYALQKRQTLIEMGYPEKALTLAIVRTPKRELHAVLIISTTDGDYVMDNLQPTIKPWNETNYSWISRQDGNNPLNWVSMATIASR